MTFLRHSLDKKTSKEEDFHEMFTKFLDGIHHVGGDQPNSEMKSKIEKWINDVFMDVNKIENTKTGYFAYILLFTGLLAATSSSENNEMNVSSLDWTCNRFLSLTHKVSYLFICRYN